MIVERFIYMEKGVGGKPVPGTAYILESLTGDGIFLGVGVKPARFYGPDVPSERILRSLEQEMNGRLVLVNRPDDTGGRERGIIQACG